MVKVRRLKRKQVKSELEKLTIRDEKRIRVTIVFYIFIASSLGSEI